MGKHHRKIPNKPRQQRVGRTQQKILLTLLAGVTLGLSGSSRRYFRILKAFKEDWQLLNNPQFSRSIESLVRQNLVKCKRRGDGTLDVKLTDKGRMFALLYNPHVQVDSKSTHWDGYWHVVMFDIPREQNKVRDSFRHHLKRLGFKELQHSVFVSPYDASEIIDTLAALHDVFSCVVYMHVARISNEHALMKHFKLRTR